jgi:YggT family protein
MHNLLCLIFTIAMLGLFAWIILSYIVNFGRLGWGHPVRKVYDTLSNVVNPLLVPIRRVLPPLRTGAVALDLSPLVLFLAIIVLRSIVGC